MATIAANKSEASPTSATTRQSWVLGLKQENIFFENIFLIEGKTNQPDNIIYNQLLFFFVVLQTGRRRRPAEKIVFLEGQKNNEEKKGTRQGALIKTRAVPGQTRGFRAGQGRAGRRTVRAGPGRAVQNRLWAHSGPATPRHVGVAAEDRNDKLPANKRLLGCPRVGWMRD